MNFRVLAALLSVAAAARANPFELYGFTPRATGMAGAMTAVGDDLGSSFYNPAALLGHTRTELGLGFADTISNLWIKGSPAGSAASQVERAPRFEGGVIFPLGGKLLKDRVVIGIGGGHPIGSLVRVQTVDEAHPQFYMYQSKAQRFALDAAVGVRIVEGLSLGVGVQIIAEQIGRVSFALDLASRQFRARDITVDLNTVPTPTAGILLEPSDRIKIGFSWRKEAQLYYAQPTSIDLGDLGTLRLDVDGLAQYWPHVFSLGVSIKLARLLVALQADYLLWANAPNDQVHVKVTPGGKVLQTLGLDALLSMESADARMGFSNVLVPHLALEYLFGPALTLRAGASVRPSVVPDQNGISNYLDNFSECLAAGATISFSDPLQVFTDPVHLDLGGQVIIANPRSGRKQAAGARWGGTLFSFSAMLRYLY
jgi:long-subunit fatty acid transport protein